MDDQLLITAVLQGKRETFGQLVRKYQQSLLTAAYHMVGQIEDAQDLTQETLVEAYRQLPSLKEHDKFRPWLFVILRNKCLRHLERRRPVVVPLDTCADQPMPAVTDSNLLDQLQHLAPTDREILAAHFLYDLSYAEIGEALGITMHTAQMRCVRARERLRAIAVHAEEEEVRRLLEGTFSAITALVDRDAFAARVLHQVNTLPPFTTGSQVISPGASSASLTAVKTAMPVIGLGYKLALGLALVLGILSLVAPMAMKARDKSFHRPDVMTTVEAQSVEAAAQHVVDLLNAKQYAEVQSRIVHHPHNLGFPSPLEDQDIQDYWEGVTHIVGVLKTIGQSTAKKEYHSSYYDLSAFTTKTRPPGAYYDSAAVTCQFEKTQGEVELLLDAQGKIYEFGVVFTKNDLSRANLLALYKQK